MPAPSFFVDFQTGAAIVSQCPNGVPAQGAACAIWGNGFGPKNTPGRDGAGAGGNGDGGGAPKSPRELARFTTRRLRRRSTDVAETSDDAANSN